MCLQCSKCQEIQDFILNSIQNPPKMQLFMYSIGYVIWIRCNNCTEYESKMSRLTHDKYFGNYINAIDISISKIWTI